MGARTVLESSLVAGLLATKVRLLRKVIQSHKCVAVLPPGACAPTLS
jgi:hypothetical protein